jgi:hypothetical protein
METIPAILIVIVGIIALVLIIKFIGGLLRAILGVVIILIAAYLLYQFVLS